MKRAKMNLLMIVGMSAIFVSSNSVFAHHEDAQPVPEAGDSEQLHVIPIDSSGVTSLSAESYLTFEHAGKTQDHDI